MHTANLIGKRSCTSRVKRNGTSRVKRNGTSRVKRNGTSRVKRNGISRVKHATCSVRHISSKQLKKRAPAQKTNWYQKRMRNKLTHT